MRLPARLVRALKLLAALERKTMSQVLRECIVERAGASAYGGGMRSGENPSPPPMRTPVHRGRGSFSRFVDSTDVFAALDRQSAASGAGTFSERAIRPDKA